MLTFSKMILGFLLVCSSDVFAQSAGAGPGAASSRMTQTVRDSLQSQYAEPNKLTRIQPLNSQMKQELAKPDLDLLSARMSNMTTLTPEDEIRKQTFIRALNGLKQCTTCSTVEVNHGPAGTVPRTYSSGTSTSENYPQCSGGKKYYNTVSRICLSKEEVARE